MPDIRIQTWNCFGAAQTLRSMLAFRGVVDAHRLSHPVVRESLAAADLVCFQELFLRDVEEFFDRLVHPHKARDSNHVTFWPLTIAGSGLGVASRFPFRSEHVRPFTRPHRRSERFARKGLLHVRVAPDSDEQHDFDVLTTHMQSGYDPSDRAIRKRQLAELRRAVDELGSKDRAFLVAGDFNICGLRSQRSGEYEDLREALADFDDLGAEADAPTFHPHPELNSLAHRFESTSPAQRLDYLLFRRATRGGPVPVRCELTLVAPLEGQGPLTFASDHFAVCATFRV